VIVVLMGDDHPVQALHRYPGLGQTPLEGGQRLDGARPGVDQRRFEPAQQIDVHIADGKRGRETDPDDVRGQLAAGRDRR
jgi:hypothetical protein